jgi:riboflavin kinase/FMN adenylyltransferase
MRSVVVTFDPHPREVLDGTPPGLLTTIEERLAIFEAAGVDMTVVIRFSREFSRMTAAEFYRAVVDGTIGVSEAVVGYDHMFGHDREAGIAELRKLGSALGFGVTVVDAVSVEGKRAGSSLIRLMVSEGRVAEAAELLGRPYALEGVVARGDGRGRTIGFPTANLTVGNPSKLVPGRGVYLAKAVLRGGSYRAMVNVGVRPTFGGQGVTVVEAHLLGFTGDLYEAPLRLEFIRRLRDEKRFSSAAELVAQLERDRAECLKDPDPVDT